MRSATEVLLEGIRAGQFGGDSEPHGDHATGFVAFLADAASEFTGHVVDLGSGAGLPALILADAFPDTSWTLIERRAGRTDLLRRAVARLGLQTRVEIVTSDVTAVAHSELRGSADWVTARSFGPPADTAECGFAFLRPGGLLLTSEPQDSTVDDRWPVLGLERVGLQFSGEWNTPSGRYVALERTAVPLPKLPRRSARKSLLF